MIPQSPPNQKFNLNVKYLLLFRSYKSNSIVLLAANQNDQFHNLIKMCPGVILVNNVICNACFPIYNRLAHRPNFTKCRSLITIHTPYSED